MSEESERAYGCLFCTTGKEMLVAEQLQQVCPEVHAITARQEKHKSLGGKKTKQEVIMLPSYVFFEAPVDMQPHACFPRESIIRVLTTLDGCWQLAGDDERFVHWLFQRNGLLGFSKAYQEGERIRIISGPLKDLEGRIRRIDRRGRSGQVIMEFNGKTISVWLGFDLIDPMSEQNAAPK